MGVNDNVDDNIFDLFKTRAKLFEYIPALNKLAEEVMKRRVCFHCEDNTVEYERDGSLGHTVRSVL